MKRIFLNGRFRRDFATLFFILAPVLSLKAQNKDPLKTEIVTTDVEHFWRAYDASKPDFKPEAFQNLYLNQGTPGLKAFINQRIQSAEHLCKIISTHPNYYASIRASTDSIVGMKAVIRNNLVKLKDLYPEAIFPPVYFVIGALNSGGTAQSAGLIIGAEMSGLTAQTPTEELGSWLKTVLKPAGEIPHLVAHELIHFQQHYDGGSLLAASVKEGSADFLAELISGKHINQHVHDFANPREKELWLEFKEIMLKRKYKGWLYSAAKDRPNDLGYWMGYQITKSYYDQKNDKKKAVYDILHITDFRKFLKESHYTDRFQ